MCWRCDKLKIKRAKQDIPVWKIVTSLTDNSCDNICKSFYKNYTYLKNALVVTQIEFKVTKNCIIGTMGFHSYSNKLKWKMRNNTIFVSKKKTPFRVQDFIEVYDYYPDTRVAKFHIPAGTKYTKNKNGEIISSAIVFDGFIN